MYWGQHVMNTEKYFPPPCEFAAIKKAAIDACDELDGVKVRRHGRSVSSLISDLMSLARMALLQHPAAATSTRSQSLARSSTVTGIHARSRSQQRRLPMMPGRAQRMMGSENGSASPMKHRWQARAYSGVSSSPAVTRVKEIAKALHSRSPVTGWNSSLLKTLSTS